MCYNQITKEVEIMTNTYLNEERYQKTKNKLQMLALIILLIGLLGGGLLLYKGITTEKIDKNALEVQQNEEFEQNGYSEKYYDLEDEIKKDDPKYFYIIFGVVTLVVTGITSLSIYITTKKREIAAFGAQQMMPIAQEGIDVMAPTVGNAAKEIAKGIKEGLKDDK